MGKLSKKERVKRKKIKRGTKDTYQFTKNERSIFPRQKAKLRLRIYGSGIFTDLFGNLTEERVFIYSRKDKTRVRHLFNCHMKEIRNLKIYR